MASFIAPVSRISSIATSNFRNSSLSGRRPRHPETHCPSHHNQRHAHVYRQSVTPVCSMPSPGMSQSHDDKQKRRRRERKGQNNDEQCEQRQRRRERQSKKSFDKRNLEMGWQFQTKADDKPIPCEKCNGSGKVECDWCHATGVLMLGDRLMCSLEGHSHCLACNNGEVKCKQCNGTGKIASWMVVNDI